MSRPYHRWTPRVARDAASILTDAQADAISRLTFHEPDEDEAVNALLERLGITLVPCCEPHDEPCRSCKAEMDAEAVDRLIDMRRDEDALRGRP